MKWSFCNATRFNDLRQDWDALNRAQNNNHILLDSRFVAPLIRHFGSDDLLLAVCTDGPQKGMAFLRKTGVSVWSTFQPAQAPLGLVVFGHPDNGHEGLMDLLRSLPGYGALLGIFQQDPLYSAFSPDPNGSTIDSIPYIETPQLTLTGTFEEYWQKRSKNLKHNLDRQNRRIKDQGRTLELSVHNDPAQMETCVSEYSRIESAGWKAAGGTAISETTAQGRFYRDMLQDFAMTGEALVFQLLLDGTVVASDLCLYRDGMLVVLKTTYDEKVEKLSPALLMRREIVRFLHENSQFRVIEFYGPVKDWHTQWMTDKRTMFHLNVCRHSWMSKTRRILKTLR